MATAGLKKRLFQFVQWLGNRLDNMFGRWAYMNSGVCIAGPVERRQVSSAGWALGMPDEEPHYSRFVAYRGIKPPTPLNDPPVPVDLPMCAVCYENICAVSAHLPYN